MVVKQYKASGPLTRLLLVCMMTGTVFCNICPTSDGLMDRLDRWVSPVSILFFVLSGAELDLKYELVGPPLAKLSLTAAGEIIPEGRTSARTTNKPEEPVSVE